MLRISHPEFQEDSQENAKVPCSGQASPGNCLLLEGVQIRRVFKQTQIVRLILRNRLN
jgi:hypothetical protein